jgi:hypothetical protein
MARARPQDDGLTIDFVTEGFEEFARQLLLGIPKRVEPIAIKKVAIDFLTAVIKRTPVDDGRARAGWQSYLVDHGIPVHLGDVDAKAVAEGTAEGTWEESFTKREAFIEIINAVNYVIYLEYGHSKQAPAGMMRITFKEFQAGEKLTDALREEFRKEIIKADKKARAKARAALARKRRRLAKASNG